jgi:hypothetical protein
LLQAAAHHWQQLRPPQDRQQLTQQAGREKLFTNLQVPEQLQLAQLDHVKFLLQAAVDRVHFLGLLPAAQMAVAVLEVMFIQHRHFYRLAHKPSQ